MTSVSTSPLVAAPSVPTRSTDLATAVRGWAALTPQSPACTLLQYGTGEAIETTLSYAELDRRARAVAARLQAVSSPGDRVAVLGSHGVEYVVAFLGCLYAGRMAVPLYCPEAGRSTERLHAVLADATPAVSLAAPSDLSHVDALRREGANTGPVLAVDGSGDPQAWRAPDVDPDAPAYLQYTSGSTRTPAGVMVTTRNLATGMGQLRDALAVGEHGPLVSWLPFFHDMGLVFGLATPLQAGGHGVYLSPLSFVQRPLRWLRALSDYRATVSVVPNFGLDLAVHRVREEDRAGLDLSALEVLANGSEPVRASSVDAFTRTYQPYGFAVSAHCPGFGLAEATLVVTVNTPDRPMTVLDLSRERLVAGEARPVPPGTEGATRLVGSGRSCGQDVRVVDPEGHVALPEGAVGEVWLRGANVCAGYHGQLEHTAEVFGAVLRDGTGSPVPGGSWLRTGDLGFVLDDELFIAGRLKDMVIVGGRNHYPVDIEATVTATVPEARVGHVAAFGVDGPAGEALVVVVEIEPRQAASLDAARTRGRVRAALSGAHQLEAHEVVLARTGSIPKTTSGKLQRRACRDRWAAGMLRTVG